MAVTKTIYAKGITNATIKPIGGTTEKKLLGIKDITMKYDMISDELEGEEKTLDIYTAVDGVDLDIKGLAFVRLDAFADMLGITLSESSDVYGIIGNAEFPYFELKFETDRITGLLGTSETSPTKVVITMPKVKIKDIDQVIKHKGYWELNLKAKAIYDDTLQGVFKIEFKGSSS